MIDDNSIINEVIMDVRETQEAFIFSHLSKYAMDNFNVVVEKEELVRAIQLIRLSKEYGPDISERWVTATQQSSALDYAYRRGVHDGLEKANKRIIDILEQEKKE